MIVNYSFSFGGDGGGKTGEEEVQGWKARQVFFLVPCFFEIIVRILVETSTRIHILRHFSNFFDLVIKLQRSPNLLPTFETCSHML